MAYRSDKTNPVLKLSNNTVYSIVACDSKAGDFITALANTMNLKESGGGGRKVLVYFSENKIGFPGIILPENDHDPIVCSLLPANNPDMFNMQVERIAQAVVADVISKGGALIHGGLCSYKGSGAVMAGPGSIGKTTASNRLPAPWISYSDDATLIIPNESGGFNAHPWPTWSRFYWNGPGGIWKVEKSIPFLALFFLRQSEKDSVEIVDTHHAKAMLIDTIEHITRLIRLNEKEKHDHVKRYVKSASIIASAVPAYRLGVSLKGEFWREMEKVMPKTINFEKPGYAVKQFPEESKQGEMYFIYRGPSMNPTFIEPELLTIEPYNGKEPKKGDIICYQIDHKNERTVHRVIAVKDSGIKTRGDNNACADGYTVDNAAVIGRVVASRKGIETRTIYGSFAGELDMYWRRSYRKINHVVSQLLYKSYGHLAATGIFRRLKPKNMIFRVAVFERYSQKYPKLVLYSRTVGTYDFRYMSWKINRPYRLFVDEKKLPVFEVPPQN